MFYSIFQKYLESTDIPGRHLMDFITFRAGIAFALALLLALVFGQTVIHRLQKMQIGEDIRDLGLAGQMEKKGTPTMGGIIIILSILIPCLLIGNLSNIYMSLMLIATVWMGTIGFLDDYRKIKFHNKDGLKGKYKVAGQVGLGLIVGLSMWFSPQIVMSENDEVMNLDRHETEIVHSPIMEKTPQTTIPFVKNHNFNYEWLTKWMPSEEAAETAGWIAFVIIVIFVVTAVSNGANLTDGLDGLCAGTSAIIAVALLIMAYLSGNLIYSGYLNIMYIPGSEEMVVYGAAFVGALVGFLWYNAFPAQVFMGDTGSLMLGGVIAVFAILIRKELLIPLLCLIFFIEDLSVMLQVAYFKHTKKRYGEGRRIFKMTPLHHHFQKDAPAGSMVLWKYPRIPMPEPRIVVRFWIVGILLAVLTFVTLKIR
ncbi:MAG: phospho-N-acetylmuramoyl-pentapeptide-transferase [Bacteroides sp.]|nr:phospho-N-acetylmuramoyl-pentapeptide-transferase [Bacteroides sp.]